MKKVLVVALLAFAGNVYSYDLANCLERTGAPMNPIDCEMLRKLEANDKAEEDRYQKRMTELKAEEQRKKAEYAAEKARLDAIEEAEYQKRKAVIDAEEAENKRYVEQLEKDDAKEEALKKSKCGKDFNALRVGMKFSRFEQCNEEPAYIEETMTKQGLVEAYRGTFYFIYVKNGQIIAYTRRRN